MRYRALALPLCLIGLVTALSGCTFNRLRHHTLKQGNTLVELQNRQILDNLAMFTQNPAAIPWHMNLKEGTTQITDSASGGAAVDLGPPSDTLPQLFGSRTIVGQWGMAPVTDPIELRLLRFAYRRAAGIDEMPDDDFLQELAHELKKQTTITPDMRAETEVFYEYRIKTHKSYPQFESSILTANNDIIVPAAHSAPVEKTPLVREVNRQVAEIQRDLARIGSGWYRTGRRLDVPHKARHVGQFQDCHVWVEPEGEEQLANLTLTVLKFSNLIKETQTLITPGSVKFSPGDRN